MLHIAAGLVLSMASLLGQVVFIGPVPKDFCQKILKRENVRPNLELKQSVHLMGTNADFYGAPLGKTPVELRKYVSSSKQVTLKKVITDANGRFDLGTVKPGKYRLLPFPTRAFQQPVKLECPAGESICNLILALRVNATDQPDSGCPIQ